MRSGGFLAQAPGADETPLSPTCYWDVLQRPPCVFPDIFVIKNSENERKEGMSIATESQIQPHGGCLIHDKCGLFLLVQVCFLLKEINLNVTFCMCVWGGISVVLCLCLCLCLYSCTPQRANLDKTLQLFPSFHQSGVPERLGRWIRVDVCVSVP